MDILEKIVARRRERIAVDKRIVPFSALHRTTTDPRILFDRSHPFKIIAECKKASPSKGVFSEEYDPVALATDYEKGGAGAISCLTEPDFFLGADAHLVAVRSAVSIPVLRKDFIVDPYQITQAWAMGADAILLIASILDTVQIIEFTDMAHDYGLQVLFEIHGEDELEKSFVAPVDAVGVNARNLKNFAIDMEAPRALRARLPQGAVAVAESGIHSEETAVAMYDAGYRAFLIGEHFMKSKDPVMAVNAIRSALVGRSTV